MTVFQHGARRWRVAATLAASAAAAQAQDGVKVVYHLMEGLPQATCAISNICNHLAAVPGTRIVVVTHGAGIDFLLYGAANAQGLPYTGWVADLAGKGVQFEVCNNTLTVRSIAKDKLAMEARIVPSGVAEVAKLQAKEGFVYLRP